MMSEDPNQENENNTDVIRKAIGALTAIGLGILVAVTVKIVIPGVSWPVLIGIVVFSMTLETVLRGMEQGSATQRYFKVALPWGAGILLFVALRVTGGNLLNFPIEVYAGRLDYSGKDFVQAVTLEILFSIICLGLAASIVRSPVFMRIMYFCACIAFVAMLCQNQSNGADRLFKASSEQIKQIIARTADGLEKKITPIWGECVSPAIAYSLDEDGNFKIIPDLDGDSKTESVKKISPKSKVLDLGSSRTVKGLLLKKVCVESSSGEYVTGDNEVWVDARKFKWGASDK